MNDFNFPDIELSFDSSQDDEEGVHYKNIVRCALSKIPELNFFGKQSVEDSFEELERKFPIVSSVFEFDGKQLTFYVLNKLRTNAFKFFYEMVSKWLIPGKRLNVTMLSATDFRIPSFSSELFTLCRITLQIDSTQDLEKIQKNLPLIVSELKLGIRSSYSATKIMEIRGLPLDEKMVAIQGYISSLSQKYPSHFHDDYLSEMQHVMINCTENFKKSRSAAHLTKIITVMYLFRKRVMSFIEKAPDNRHLFLKIFRTNRAASQDKKNVLAIVVGVNFLRDKELFEKKHLAKALQNYIPEAKAIDASFLAIRRGFEPICTLYLEFEKVSKQPFTKQELLLLNRDLPIDLKGRIQHLMHPVFMPRNEEEIMRNILSLSEEARFINDLPQTMITFDTQSHSHLLFTVIVVRVAKPGEESLEELFRKADIDIEYLHDRCKTIGYLRKKYVKEASVFTLKLPAEPYFRRDQSIDLSKARQAVASYLYRALGEFRDYNGGMISKQQQLLEKVRALLGKSIKYNDLVLENLFYSLFPEVMRTVLDASALTTLFEMQVKALENLLDRKKDIPMILKFDEQYVYAMVTANSPRLKDELEKAIKSFIDTPTRVAKSCVTIYDVPYLGFIYQNSNPLSQKSFCQALQNVVTRECFVAYT